MKHIKAKEYEIKVMKINSDQKAIINDQFKKGVIHVVNKLSIDNDIKDENILGKVTRLNLLNNKTILRIEFKNMVSVIESNYVIKYTEKNGFVVIPV